MMKNPYWYEYWSLIYANNRVYYGQFDNRDVSRLSTQNAFLLRADLSMNKTRVIAIPQCGSVYFENFPKVLRQDPLMLEKMKYVFDDLTSLIERTREQCFDKRLSNIQTWDTVCLSDPINDKISGNNACVIEKNNTIIRLTNVKFETGEVEVRKSGFFSRQEFNIMKSVEVDLCLERKSIIKMDDEECDMPVKIKYTTPSLLVTSDNMFILGLEYLSKYEDNILKGRG